MMGHMIKVKIDRPEPNVFFVEDGYTVSYPEDVTILEVLNEDDETIAVFRDWLWAMPATEEEQEEEEVDLPVPQFADVETIEAVLDPEYVSYVRNGSRDASEAPDDETEAPAL